MNNESPELSEAYHGGIDFAECVALGMNPDDLIDFSSNILPAGHSPRVRQAVDQARMDRYPDRECHELLKSLSQVYALESNRMVVGNGCCELIHLVANTFLKERDRVLILGPTFSEYERVSRLAGCHVQVVQSQAQAQFVVNEADVASALTLHKPKMVWLCNPNNPTGKSIAVPPALRRIDEHPETLFVVDESYIEFSDASLTLIHTNRPNVIVLRSLTKFHAIAGLRLGFVVSTFDLAKKMRLRRIAWSVNALAQAAGVAVLQDHDFYQSELSKLQGAKRDLMTGLSELGLSLVPSDTCFFLVQVESASDVRSGLLKARLLVRSCESFELKDYVRLSVRTEAENNVLIEAWKNLLGR